ncbi:hypothetical protein JCM30566_10610 [Marinitoga arctica]
MYTYGLILVANDTDQAYELASKYAKRYGNHNISSCINYLEEKKMFEDTVNDLIIMYENLKEASKNMINRFENKVSEDDFILNQLKENMKRYENGNYAYPEEWKLVFHDGKDFVHIDNYKYFDDIKSNNDLKNLYLLIVDIF